MKKSTYSKRYTKITVLITAIFFCTIVFVAPMSPQATYIPPVTITSNDIIAADVNFMISYPHLGTPVFVEPGRQFTAEVAAPSSWGTGGWTAWVETDYKRWDCTVGMVCYGPTNIFLNTRAGYTIPVTIPVDVSPELCTLVVSTSSGMLRSPLSVSVVPKLDTNFYIGDVTDTHFGWNNEGTVSGDNAPTAFGLMSKVMTLGGARFFSHTGDIDLYPLCSRAVGIKEMVIDELLQWCGGKVPFIVAAGNHEHDPFVEPGPDTVTGTRTGDFGFIDFDRYFGMRSQIMMMGTFAAAKHDFSAYNGDYGQLTAITNKWNATAGAAKYRLLMQHSYGPQYTALFGGQAPQPAPNPDLIIKGHDHWWGVNQPSPYYILSMGGGGPWTGGSGTMLNFNYDGSNWSCAQANASYGINNKMVFINDARVATAQTKLRDSFASLNNGTATGNTCTITNQVNFNYYDGRERFIMAKGNYAVTGGTMLSQYNSDDGNKTIVLVKVNIPAGSDASPSTTTLTITRSSVIPSPIPTVQPTATPAPTPAPTPANMMAPYLDPTFELAWTRSVPFASSATISRVTGSDTAPHLGSYSMKVTQSATGGMVFLYPNRNLIAGHTYSYSVWLKAGSGYTGNVNLKMYIGWETPTRDGLPNNVIVGTGTDGWHNLKGTVTMPTAGTGGIYLRISANQDVGSAYDCFYIDDVYLADLFAPTVIGSAPANSSAVGDAVSSMMLLFNNPMDSATLTTTQIKVNGSNSLVSSIIPHSTKGGVTINFTEPLTEGSYTVSLTGCMDTLGQTMPPTDISFFKGQPTPTPPPTPTPEPTPKPGATFAPAFPLIISKPIIKAGGYQVNTLPSTGTVYVTAKIANAGSNALPNKAVTILVYKDAPIETNIIYLDQSLSDEDGKIKFAFVPDAQVRAGTYTVLVGGENVNTAIATTITPDSQSQPVNHTNPDVQNTAVISNLLINIPLNNDVAVELGYTTTDMPEDKNAVVVVAQYNSSGALVAVKLTNVTFLAGKATATLPAITVPIEERTSTMSIMALDTINSVKPLYYKTVYKK